MAQTPALMYADGDMVDYTPGSSVIAGEVVLLGSRPCITPAAIEASVKGSLAVDGIWKVPQKAEIFTAGDAVYWDADGTPVTGTALSGAATGTASAGYLMGIAAETTAATDTYVKVVLRGATSTATIGGSITAADIEAEDSSLGINGLDAAQGGAIAIAGGTSSTAGNAGGAITITGGTPGASGVGGAITLAGAAGGSSSGTGGAMTIRGGAGTASNANGGALALDGGAPHGSGTAGAITIGTNNAASITLGKMPRIPVATVAVGGTAIGNANAVTEGITIVTGADDTAAVKLPEAVAGAQVIIFSTTSGKNLIVFPAVNDAIDALGANNAFNSATDAPKLLFVATSASQWYSMIDKAS